MPFSDDDLLGIGAGSKPVAIEDQERLYRELADELLITRRQLRNVRAQWDEAKEMQTMTTEAAHADSLFPAGCRCASMDSGGDCDWCRAYYEKLAAPSARSEPRQRPISDRRK